MEYFVILGMPWQKRHSGWLIFIENEFRIITPYEDCHIGYLLHSIFLSMDKKYIIAIANNPQAGANMISILIVDTKPASNNSEVFSAVINKSEKAPRLRSFLEKYGEDAHIIDISN